MKPDHGSVPSSRPIRHSKWLIINIKGSPNGNTLRDKKVLNARVMLLALDAVRNAIAISIANMRIMIENVVFMPGGCTLLPGSRLQIGDYLDSLERRSGDDVPGRGDG